MKTEKTDLTSAREDFLQSVAVGCDMGDGCVSNITLEADTIATIKNLLGVEE